MPPQGPVIRDPVPAWLQPEGKSVFESPGTTALRTIAEYLGLTDPAGAVMGVASPLMAAKPPLEGPLGRVVGAAKRKLSDVVRQGEHGTIGPVFDQLKNVEAFQTLARDGRIHSATGTFTAAEEAARTPISSGEAAGYSPADIARFFLERRGGEPRYAAYEFVKALQTEGRPIQAALWDEVVTKPPTGYVRVGDQYVPRQSR